MEFAAETESMRQAVVAAAAYILLSETPISYLLSSPQFLLHFFNIIGIHVHHSASEPQLQISADLSLGCDFQIDFQM